MATRNRFRFTFWLDCSKDDELLLAEQIDALKRQRSFTSAIRDGLRLVIDLRAGRLDVLQELFPFAVAAMRPAPATNGNGHHATNGHHTSAGHDLPDLVITKASGIDATANFLNSLAALGIDAGGSADEAKQTRAAFAGSMGDLFGGDDENELWE